MGFMDMECIGFRVYGLGDLSTSDCRDLRLSSSED